MHSNIYELTWFKLGLIIPDTSKLHLFKLVCVTLSFVQGHGDARKEQLLSQLSPKVVNGFGWDLTCC